jgi:hypothetical protein
MSRSSFLLRIHGRLPVVTPPVNTAPPSIFGFAAEGQVLTASTGSWSGNPTSFAYQWKAAASNVGANANTYVPSSADLGKLITVTVTASNTAGSASATAAGVGPVAEAGGDANVVFGANTRAGYGGADVLGGAIIVGGEGQTDWAANGAGLLVPQGAYGTVRTYSRSSYDLTLSDGRSLHIDMIPNVAHVISTAADAAGSFQLYAMASTENGQPGAVRLGDTIVWRSCVFNPAGSALWSIRPRGAYTQGPGAGTRITVTSEVVDATLDADGNPNLMHGTKIGGLGINAQSGGDIEYPWDFVNLWYFRAVKGDYPLFDWNVSAGGGERHLNCRYEFAEAVTSGWQPAINCNRNAVVDGCRFVRCAKCVTAEGPQTTVTNSIFSTLFDDGLSLIGGNNVVTDNLFFDFRWTLSNHPDGIQQRVSDVPTDVPPVPSFGNFKVGVYERNYIIRGVGTPGYICAQGIFMRNSTGGDRYSGGVDIRNNIVLITMEWGVYAQTVDDPDIRFNTVLSDFQSQPVITVTEPRSPPATIAIPAEVGRNGTGGRISHNTANAYDLSGQADIVDQSYNKTLSRTLPDYLAMFPNFTNDPAALRSRAGVILAFTPAEGGPAANPDGTYSTSLFPDGSNNDGGIYVEGRLPPAA